MTVSHLADFLELSAARWADRTAVIDPAGWSLTYAELNGRADALAARLVEAGVQQGDRVGLVLPKTAASVVSIFGILKAGAAYVPVDYTAPAERGHRILTDCQIRAAVIDASCLSFLPPPEAGPLAAIFVLGDDTGETMHGPEFQQFDEAVARGGAAPALPRALDDLAYILNTSGSTGVPKGVTLTHENAISFVDWCSSVFEPTESDRFSSHAPFHFDLSILDIFVSIKHGATLCLISEAVGKSPRELAAVIEQQRLTVWYSTPSILTLLVQFGQLESIDASSLRIVLFAGEVFPVKHLRALKQHWPGPVYYNLYGPTETNVCTFARIPERVPDDRDQPYPIGFACSHCEPWVLDENEGEVPEGEEGLLYISGPSVFQGYWNRAEMNATVFLNRDGKRWYNTGDVVKWQPDEGFIYLGRRDRMVKRRGYRIELGEIERALYRHPQVREAAVVALPDADAGVRIVACLTAAGSTPPSMIAMKTFCAAHLPVYMSPDRFEWLDHLPHTSTDKTDYQALKRRLTGEA
jgi:amino acid adenylation domain-containing protein